MKKENSQPILSMSLLCSGRNKDEMTKCLESLMTIRKRLPSEIIAVDTGCDENTKPILKKYADQTVEFTWCNDFAKARNAGLEKCSGKWFMFIDDDEWFENTDDLVAFFKSGEYESYGHAEYRVRNYNDRKMLTGYQDFWALRLIRLDKDTCFHGKIHEFLMPQKGKCKRIQSYVHHFGYVYETKKERYEKEIRNIPLLLEMVKEEPGELRWRSQLVQDLSIADDYGRLSDLCDSTLKAIDKYDTPEINRLRTDFYIGKLIADTSTYQYDKAIEDFNSYKKDKRNTRICVAALYYYAVMAYWEKKDYDHVFQCALRYFEIYDGLREKKNFDEIFIQESSFIIRDIFSRYFLLYCTGRVVYAAAVTDHVDTVHKFFDRFDLNEANAVLMNPFCDGMTEAFANFDFDKRFVAYADQMLLHGDMVKRLLSNARDIDVKEHERFNGLVKVYGQTTICDHYILLYIRLMYADSVHDIDKMHEMYKKLFTYVVDIFDLDSDIWKVADKNDIDLKTMFKGIPYEQWGSGVDAYMNSHKNSFADMKRKENLFKGDDDVRFRYFRLKCIETQISNDSHLDKAAPKLPIYCSDCISFYSSIYRPELFSGMMTVIPPQCRFAVRFLDAIDTKKDIKSRDRIKELEECVDIYAPFNLVLGEYIKEYGEKEKNKLLLIQKHPELEKVYQMLALLQQAMDLQEKTGSEELQAGIMQQRQLIEEMLESIKCQDFNGDRLDNGEWLTAINDILFKNVTEKQGL